MQSFPSVFFSNLRTMTEIVSLCMFGKELQGQLDEDLQFTKLSLVEDRLNIIEFLGFIW